jgi:hypothetical protein
MTQASFKAFLVDNHTVPEVLDTVVVPFPAMAEAEVRVTTRDQHRINMKGSVVIPMDRKVEVWVLVRPTHPWLTHHIVRTKKVDFLGLDCRVWVQQLLFKPLQA